MRKCRGEAVTERSAHACADPVQITPLSNSIHQLTGCGDARREQGKSSMHPNIRLAAIAAACATLHCPASAADEELPQVVVTATRFDDADPRIPSNITVLSRKDLRSIPANSVPDLLKVVAGVDSRPLYGPLGMDATIDMRGFGSTGSSNTLLLLDGMRLNPVDMGSIIWSAIPIESIERIEIMRGTGTVLYGDGATGGVINIITDKSGKPRTNVSVTAGSRDYKDIQFEIARGSDIGYFNFFGKGASTDGYRNNNHQDQTSASGRAGLFLDRGEVFANYSFYRESSGLPGNRLSAQYRNDPRGTSSPLNDQNRDGYMIRPGISYRATPTLTLEAETGVEHQELNSRYVSSKYFSDRVRDRVFLTPRLRWQHGLGTHTSETVVGLDYYDGDVTSTNRGGPNQDASQTSSAIYAQNNTGLTDHVNLTIGGRNQRVKQKAAQDAYAAWFTPAMSGDSTRSRSAYDLGLTYAKDEWRIYGKTGTTFRFANVDELFGSDAFGNPVFAGDLRPQHGTINEIGGQFRGAKGGMRASLYQLDLKDEIGYDGALFANTNFDPTRRQGLETEADWRVTNTITLKASYAYINAKFRDGTYAGKEVPLVSRHQGTIQAIWNTGPTGTYSGVVRRMGERRFDSDFSNTQGMLDGYTTVDLQAEWNLKPWRVTAKLLNATDKKYSPFAGYSSSKSDTYYYPADGRAFFMTGRYDF